MGSSRVGILIPAFNEEVSIRSVVMDVKKHGAVFVIDDGSTDDTVAEALTAGANVIKNKKNVGYDATLKRGMVELFYKGYEYLITVDADGQHDVNDVGRIVSRLKFGNDAVVAVRNRKQRIAEHVFNIYTRIFYGIRDPLTGLKGYRLSTFGEKPNFSNFDTVGTEIIVYFALKRLRIEYINTRIKERSGGDKPRFGGSFLGNISIFVALFKLMSLIRKKNVC